MTAPQSNAALATPKFIVVENAGYTNERDVGSFGTRHAAESWVRRTYTATELDVTSSACLHVDVCMQVDGQRTYDPCGFDHATAPADDDRSESGQ